MRPGLAGSYEAAFHDTEIARFLLTFRERDRDAAAICASRGSSGRLA